MSMSQAPVNLLVSNTPLSLGADAHTQALFIGKSLGCSIQAVWTGTPTGDFKLQVSNDPGPSEGALTATAGITNWTDYASSTHAAGAGAGSFVWDIPFTGIRWIRLVYTSTSGSGTLTVAQAQVKG